MSVGANARTGSRRLGGVDAARAVAVLGMVMVHFGPTPAPDTALGNLYGVPHGRASVLFVLLAGVGVALLSAGGPSEKAPRRLANVRGRLILRAALLLPLGLWLQGLDHGVLVILQYYAVYFVLAAFVLTFPDRWLLAGAVAAPPGGALVVCACVNWRAALPRGPLEAALVTPWWIVERGLRHLDRKPGTRLEPSAQGKESGPSS